MAKPSPCRHCGVQPDVEKPDRLCGSCRDRFNQRRIEDAARFALVVLSTKHSPDAHRTAGAYCGEDVCWLCSAEVQLEEALAAVRPRWRTEQAQSLKTWLERIPES